MHRLTAPRRIRLSRAKGWRLPEGAVNVARPTLWGNPFVVGQPSGCEFADGGDQTPLIAALTLDQALAFYRDAVRGMLSPEMHPHGHRWVATFRRRMNCHPFEWLSTLRGRDLACWCRPPPDGEPDLCHAAVLIEMANAPLSRATMED